MEQELIALWTTDGHGRSDYDEKMDYINQKLRDGWVIEKMIEANLRLYVYLVKK